MVAMAAGQTSLKGLMGNHRFEGSSARGGGALPQEQSAGEYDDEA